MEKTLVSVLVHQMSSNAHPHLKFHPCEYGVCATMFHYVPEPSLLEHLPAHESQSARSV